MLHLDLEVGRPRGRTRRQRGRRDRRRGGGGGSSSSDAVDHHARRLRNGGRRPSRSEFGGHGVGGSRADCVGRRRLQEEIRLQKEIRPKERRPPSERASERGNGRPGDRREQTHTQGDKSRTRVCVARASLSSSSSLCVSRCCRECRRRTAHCERTGGDEVHPRRMYRLASRVGWLPCVPFLSGRSRVALVSCCTSPGERLASRWWVRRAPGRRAERHRRTWWARTDRASSGASSQARLGLGGRPCTSR